MKDFAPFVKLQRSKVECMIVNYNDRQSIFGIINKSSKPENVDIFFCLMFMRWCQNLVFGGETGY